MTDVAQPGPRDGDGAPVYDAAIPPRAIAALGVLAIGTVLVITAIDRAQELLGLLLFASVLAAVMGPLINRVGTAVGKVAASVGLHLILLLLLIASTTLIVQQIRVEAAALEDYAAVQLEELDEGGSPGILSRANLSQRVGEAATSWGTIAVLGDDEATGIAARLSQLLIIIVLSVFLSLQSGAVIDMVVGWVDNRDRRRVIRELWSISVGAAASYLRRSLLVAAASGAAGAAVAAAFGLPGVVLIGVWAGLLTMVPMLGSAVGWLPIVVLAAINLPIGSTLAIAALAIGAIALTTVARARFTTAAADPGSFIVAVGIAAGLSGAGLPGAAAGLFLAVGGSMAISRHRMLRMVSPIDGEAGTEGARDHGTPTGSLGRSSEPAGPPDDHDLQPVVASVGKVGLQLTRQTAFQIAALIVFAFMVQLSISRVGPTLVWATVGVLVAVGLDRPVTWVQRRIGLRRSWIVIASAVVVAGALTALVMSTRWQLNGTTTAEGDLSEIGASLEGLPLIGAQLAEIGLDERISEVERELPRFLNRSPMAGRAVGLIGGGLVGLFWVATTALTALLDGPRLIGAIDRRVPARIRRQTRRLAQAAQVALAGYVAGSALVAALNGVLIATMALAIGAPMPLALAIWAFTWNFVPQIGAIIGWVPVLVLALAAGSITGIVCLIIFVIYQAVENNLIQPTIVGQAVNISPLSALGAALFGAAVGGLLGAVLAIPIVGVGRAVVSEYRRDDFPRLRISQAATDVTGDAMMQADSASNATRPLP